MAHDEPLVPWEMQERKTQLIEISATVSMMRGLIAWLDGRGYTYRIFPKGEKEND